MIIVKPFSITDGVLTSSNIPETDYTEYNPATPYTIGEVVMVTDSGVHKVYEALASSTGAYPPSYTTGVSPKWLDIGSTNRWRMFNGNTSTYTTNPSGDIVVIFAIDQVVNSLTLFGLSGLSVSIQVTDVIEGVIYDKTIPLVDNSSVSSWYEYHFDEVTAKSDLTLLDIPNYSNTTMTITIAGNATTCSLLVMGSQKKLGCTDYGTGIGIVDYSIKQTDDFGNFYIQQRKFSKRVDYNVTVETPSISDIQRTLAGYRSTPIIWIGNPDYEETIVYGYYRDFSIVISNFSISDCSIEVEGL